MVNGYGAILCSAVEQVGSEFNKVMKIKSKLKLQRPGRTRMGRLDDLHKASSRSWDSFVFDSACGSAPRLVRSGRAANFLYHRFSFHPSPQLRKEGFATQYRQEPWQNFDPAVPTFQNSLLFRTRMLAQILHSRGLVLSKIRPPTFS